MSAPVEVMRVENVFDVPAAPERAWSLLIDVPRIVPCMPGAELERTVDESTWEILQRVRLGPISLQFRSQVMRTELDERARRAVLLVKAKEVRGRGGAEATIESSLDPLEGGTRVKLVTALELKGSVAQYGRPVVGSVAEQLTREFATCLAAMLETDEPPPAAQDVKPIGGLRLVLGSSWQKARRRA